jgi:hypothetical protein
LVLSSLPGLCRGNKDRICNGLHNKVFRIHRPIICNFLIGEDPVVIRTIVQTELLSIAAAEILVCWLKYSVFAMLLIGVRNNDVVIVRRSEREDENKKLVLRIKRGLLARKGTFIPPSNVNIAKVILHLAGKTPLAREHTNSWHNVIAFLVRNFSDTLPLALVF